MTRVATLDQVCSSQNMSVEIDITERIVETRIERDVTVVEGKPMPPTPKPGQGYTYVDLTKHAKPQK
jgi:hypothetical protein